MYSILEYRQAVAAKPLTTTSYALLSHLAVQPWSAYELAQQMRRGMDLVWPRAESAIYEEPKNLVAHGLARVSKRPAGRRTRAVYAITPAGRRALERWSKTEPSVPEFESEALLRVFFAEQARRAEVLAAIESIGRFGADVRARLVAQLQGYLDQGGPFPERWHVIGIGSRFLLGMAAWMEEWSAWAADEVRGWSTVDTPRGRGEGVIRQSIARYGGRVSGVRADR
jgi:PadR family transcriptional regulator, regulatory protein AphA